MKKYKKYLNSKDIKHYFKYGPMDFDWEQAFFYYLIFDLPFFTLIYLLIYFIKNS